MKTHKYLALADRIINVPSYTAEAFGAFAIREHGGPRLPEGASVILVNAKYRSAIAAALLLFGAE